ncbi:Sorting nexin, cytoplasm-to-vacuole targeting pathway/endosomal sorting [Dipsacomyces acuminosporus]|nr:Sorting nexin, cytoplasm-to-vacuole targeting pathway/endosomal sorting [Dipsacomyces acuminosporus]
MTDFGDYCCGIDRHIHELLEDSEEQKKSNEIRNVGYQPPQFYHVVHINEAEKLTESGSSFIAYSIVFGDYEVKRRYSEFESLRTCLCRLYPTFIVPPIPEKHSIAQYAVLQKRAKEDQYIIERRKRMLEHFINHLVEHPILSSEHIFQRFLENGVSWTEVLHSPIITNLPKSPLHSSPSRAPGSSINDGTNIQLPKIAATNSFAGDVPIPSTLSPIKNVEPRWMDCELFTNKYANQFTGLVEKSENKIYRKLGELSADYAELGATLNGFSLLEQEQEELAAAIEKAGQAVDSSYIEINQLLTQMEAEVSEPIHEYSQYASAIKQVLKFRLLKNLQAENVQEALIRQRVKLENLLQADDEAKRLAQALESSGHSATNNTVRKDTPSLGPFPEAQRQQHHRAVSQSSTIATSSSSNNNNNNNNSNNNGSTSSLGARLLRSPKVLGDGIMSKLTYALNGMMDVDPEQMRRNQIGRASDKISMLEEQLEMLSNDLVLVNTSTQDNLDRFQKQKVREMKGILIAFAKMHLEWAEKNLEIWKEAKEAVDEV